MKKILSSAIIAVFLVILPFISFAKTAVSESELDAVTAEAGVTLDFGSSTGTYTGATVMVTNFSPSLISWGDSNGFGSTYTSSGWVGASNISMGAAASILVYNAMTLDVGSSGTVTKLNIGLPSVMVHPVTTDATIRLGTSKQLTDNQILGTFYNDQFAVILNPTGVGSIAISNHSTTNTQGIETTFSNVYLAIPAVAIDASWGDSNGFGSTYTSAGFFGVKDYVTSESMLIALSGTSSLDVGTSGERTVLNMVLPSTTINAGLANITAPLVLGSVKDFSDGQQLLGTLDMRGFKTNVTGSMQIYSH